MPDQIPPPLDQAPLAYEDSAFLDSSEGRPLRILAEYAEPMARFRAQRIEDTVVLFGSARIHSREAALAALASPAQEAVISTEAQRSGETPVFPATTSAATADPKPPSPCPASTRTPAPSPASTPPGP